MADVDALIIGGGPAGLAAAMSLGRAQRSVLVVDAGDPGHFAADAIHNVIGFDGVAPREFRAEAWRQLATYDVSRRDDRVLAVAREDAGFAATCASGVELRARVLVLAGGQRYRMPDVPGMQELLGSRVFHCPFCHGWEVRGSRLALVTGAEAAGFVDMLRLWSDDVEFVDADTPGLRVTALDPAGVAITGDGIDLVVDAVFAHPRLESVDDLPEQLGLERIESPMSVEPAIVGTSFPPGSTGVPGVFAAGDLSTVPPSVAGALASGTMAGGAAAHHLAQQFAAARAARA